MAKKTNWETGAETASSLFEELAQMLGIEFKGTNITKKKCQNIIDGVKNLIEEYGLYRDIAETSNAELAGKLKEQDVAYYEQLSKAIEEMQGAIDEANNQSIEQSNEFWKFFDEKMNESKEKYDPNNIRKQVNDLKSEVQQLKAQNGQLREMVANLETKNSNLTIKISNLETQINDLETKNNNQATQIGDMQIVNRLQAEKDRLQDERDELSTKISDWTAKIEDLETKNNNQATQIEELQTQNAAQATQIEELQTENEKSKTRIKGLIKKVAVFSLVIGMTLGIAGNTFYQSCNDKNNTLDDNQNGNNPGISEDVGGDTENNGDTNKNPSQGDVEIEKAKDQFFTFDNEIPAEIKKAIVNQKAGVVSNVTCSYNAESGEVILVGQSVKSEKTSLVIGNCKTDANKNLTENDVESLVSEMTYTVYNEHSDGVYYSTSQKQTGDMINFTISACKIDNNGNVTVVKSGKESCSSAKFNENAESIKDKLKEELSSQSVENSQSVEDEELYQLPEN